MELTSAQAAAKLGISTGRVRSLIQRGQLTNVRPDAGAHKQVRLDAKQVAEFAKTFNPKYVPRRRSANGHGPVVSVSPAAGGQGALFTRLASIEAKLDTLLRLLS